MKTIEAENLKKIYGKGETAVHALDGVSLSVNRGEFLAVVGSSGSGKTTLLHMLGGLDRPSSGRVRIDGRELSELTDDQLAIFRRRNIGFVFQDYNLVPMMNVHENILLPLGLDGRKPDKEYVGEIIRSLGIADRMNSYPAQLSGGQQQRVAIARALVAKPSVFLADEPTGNLDSRTSQDVMGILKVTGRRFQQTMVLITHNEEIAQMADRILRLEDGRILEGGRRYA